MRTIKVLLIGGIKSFVVDAIVGKLLKEKCSLSYIVGDEGSKTAPVNSKIVTYHANLDDEYIQYIIKSIMPDAVIFTGAFDERYFWSDYHRCSSKYMSELTNILVSAADLGVKKFIYLSTVNVYGFNNSGVIDEETPLAPENMKSIIVAQGEKICQNMSESGKINTISLRFGTIYGNTTFDKIESDYIVGKCHKAITDKKIIRNNQVMPIIAVQDVAIAVYKAISLDADSGAYNVCDNETISDSDICDIILEAYSDIEIEVEEDNKFKPQKYKIDGSKFNNWYSFFQKTNYKEGILDTAKFVKENVSKYKNTPVHYNTDDKKNLWFYIKFLGQKLVPFAENIIVFFMFSFFEYLFRDNQFLSSIDIFALYVVIISITFGKQQAILSVILSFVHAVLELRNAGELLITLFVNYSFLTRMMFHFILGMVVGHTRDMMRQKIQNDEDRIEYIENEYTKLNEINDITVMVKQALEERLFSQGDSLAKIYSIIEQIDSLMPPKTYLASLQVFRELFKSEHICIYQKGENSRTYYLEYWTSEYSREMGDELNLLNYPDIANNLSKNSIFNNKELKKGFPLLASAIKREDVTEAIIMMWDIEFERLTLYHINLFITITKIINRSIGKALNYRDNLDGMFKLRYNYDIFKLKSNQFDKNVHFTNNVEFKELLISAEEGELKYNIPYKLTTLPNENISIEGIVSDIRQEFKKSIYINIDGKLFKILLLNCDEVKGEADIKAAENA